MENKFANCIYCEEQFVKQYPTQKYCSVKCANKRNNVLRSKQVKLPNKFDIPFAEFIGILFGDGSVTTYRVRVSLNAIEDREYAFFVVRLIKQIFPGGGVISYFRPRDNTIEILISSKIIADYLKKTGFNSSRRVPTWIRENPEFLKAFIRGLFDTEGSVGFKKFNGRNGKYLYKQLTFTNRNKNLLNFVIKNLRKFEFKPTMESKKNIYISNLKDIQRFLKEIKLHNPKLINKILMKNKDGYIVRLGRGPQEWRGTKVAESAALEMR